jgi:hypothetical protein
MRAYLNQKSEYDEALAAVKVQAGIEISGRNPALNREVERAELKRGAISLLTQRSWEHLEGVGAIKPSEKELKDLPEIDFEKWREQAPVIQFLEQAFEWEHMVYTFYPYFWARKQLWPFLQRLDDVDPQHAAFLRAGAARVLVPVRLGYEGSVLWYAHRGEPWNGKGPPSTGHDAFIPYIEEAKERLGFDFDVGPGLIKVTDGQSMVTGVPKETKLAITGGFDVGPGLVKATDGEPVVSSVQKGAKLSITGGGFKTSFSRDDENRELLIDGKRYRIRKVDEEKQVVTLSEPYRAEPSKAAPNPPSDDGDEESNGLPSMTREVGYWISQYKLVGEPWEVKIPTSLVYLEQDKVKLPTFQ